MPIHPILCRKSVSFCICACIIRFELFPLFLLQYLQIKHGKYIDKYTWLCYHDDAQ